MNFAIDPELDVFLPRLTDAELKQLEANTVAAQGANITITVWAEAGVIVDGHNGWRCCQKHGFTPGRLVEKSFADKDEAELWMVENQAGRRNMSPNQLSVFRGIHFRLLKKRAGRPTSGQANGITAQVLAEKYGVSEATINRDAIVAQAPPEVRQKYEAGDLTKQEVIDTLVPPKIEPPQNAGDAWEPPPAEQLARELERQAQVRKTTKCFFTLLRRLEKLSGRDKSSQKMYHQAKVLAKKAQQAWEDALLEQGTLL